MVCTSTHLTATQLDHNDTNKPVEMKKKINKTKHGKLFKIPFVWSKSFCLH